MVALLLLGGPLFAQTGPAYFEYPNDSACAGNFSPPVFAINQSSSGGTFVSTPAGLSLDPVSGTITTSTSQLGTYSVSHITTSPSVDTHTVSITLIPISSASISYPVNIACPETWDLLPVDTVIPPVSGTYSSVPPGLSLDPITGTVDVDASTPGIYVVQFVVDNGICPDTASVQLEINSLNGFQLDYGQDTFCPTGTILPLAQPPINGQYAAVSGLAYSNDSIGEIDLGFCVPDRQYIIQFVEDGGCMRRLIDTIYLADFDDASFTYPSLVFCDNVDSITPTIPGDTGIFTWVGIFVNNVMDLNAFTGTVIPANSTPSTYDITHTTSGTCPSSITQTYWVAEAPAPFTLVENGNVLEVPVAGMVDWYCDSALVLSNSNVLVTTMVGIYWATLTNSDGCTTMSNIINTDPTDVLDPALLRSGLTVFPNPSSGVFHLQSRLPGSGDLSTQVFDLTGKVLFENEVPVSVGGELDLTALTPGHYFLRVTYRGASTAFPIHKIDR